MTATEGAPEEPQARGPRTAPRVLRRWLFVGVSIVSGLGLAIELAHALADHELIEAVLPKLSLSFESNLPTWWSSSLLLGCAIAAGSIAAARVRSRRHWWALAIGFGYASLDEAAELHEQLGGHLDLGGVLYFDWVIPAVAIVGVLAAVFLPFVRALPSPLRDRLVVAGVIYVAGALVMELPLGWWTERAGPDSLGYAMIDWVEETLEMVGAALGLVALVDHRRGLG